MPGDVTSQIFWLKNRRPDKWKDKQELDHTTGGDKITGFTVIIDDGKKEK